MICKGLLLAIPFGVDYFGNFYSDVSKSFCFSLGCYSTSDIRARLISAPDSPPPDELLSFLPCSWPKKGGLSMTIQSYNGGDNRLPLAPPLVVSTFYPLTAAIAELH
jgi:hypothetical protein